MNEEFNNINYSGGFGVPEKAQKNIIMTIGVGGGGSNAVKHMFGQNIDGVSFVVCNTDRQALESHPVSSRVLLGPNTTKGLGAGGDTDLARQAAEESADNIKELFNDDIRMVFVTAGMGGGTGTGAGPVIARLAREKGLLTIGIVTIPFLFEGESKIIKALDGAEEMSKQVDAILLINNQRLIDIYPTLNFLNAFDKADETLSIAARSISDIITIEGKINRDFNDVNTTLRNGGTAIISTGYGEGENRVTKAIEDALKSPLLKNSDVFSSKKLLFVIYFDPNSEFQMSESDQLTAFTAGIDPGVEIIWGVYPDATLGEKVKITILASGFKSSFTQRPASRTDNTPRPSLNGQRPAESATQRPVESGQRPVETPNKGSFIEEQYGPMLDRSRQRQIILKPDQFDDDSVINALEESVTFNRDRRTADDIRSRRSSNPQPSSPYGYTSFGNEGIHGDVDGNRISFIE